MWKRLLAPVALAATVAVTVLMRVPALVSRVPLTFDDGVYGASVLAMRDGAAPFREVFSSQGPLFLPVLWLFDLIGLRDFRAMRLSMVAAAVAITLGTYVLLHRVGTRGVAVLGAAVTGTAATTWSAAGPVQSDGIALALALWAVVLAMGWGRLGRRRSLVVGLLIGAAVAVKSLFVVPAGLAVTWLFAARRDWRGLATASSAGVALLLVVSLPWGLGNVWDQYVRFHLDTPRRREPLRNLHRIGEALWRREALVLAFAGAGIFGLLLPRPREPSPDRDGRGAVLVWLVATVLLFVFGIEFARGSQRFLVFALPPLLASIAILRPPIVIALVATVAATPWYFAGNNDLFSGNAQTAIHLELETELDSLADGCLVISDRPGMVWMAERRTPPDLVDTSWARITSGNLNLDQVVAGAQHPDTCGVLFYSGRFDWMDRALPDRLDGYSLARDWGEGRRLYLRPPG